MTGEALVRHQTACRYTNAAGKTVIAMEHRAGWDATFSAPKSVSLTALVGGDDRVREAHRRGGRRRAPGARALCAGPPRRAPDTRTHRELGRRHVRARQRPAGQRLRRPAAPYPRRGLQSDAYPELATCVPCSRRSCIGRSSLRPRCTGRSWPRDCTNWATTSSAGPAANPRFAATATPIWRPRARAGSRSRPTSRRTDKHGAASAQVAAHHTREPKIDRSHAEMQRQHQDLAQAFGDQPAHVVAGRPRARLTSRTARPARVGAHGRGLRREPRL